MTPIQRADDRRAQIVTHALQEGSRQTPRTSKRGLCARSVNRAGRPMDRYQITKFKSLKVALKEIEPYVRDGKHLESGKPFKRFGGMRSREVLANWLLCVVANHAFGG